MPKVTFIGAGSLIFTRRLVIDILSFPTMRDATIALMDINPERLRLIHKIVRRIVREGQYPAKVIATTDRKEALKGADFVLTTILVGGVEVFRHEVQIPIKYGVDTCVGDSMGPSGVFRAMRTIPVMLEICKDIERYAPGAYLLNYTNPMSMLCRAMRRATDVRLVGLCHSVQGTASMLARWVGAPVGEIDYLCAGINHQAWFLEFKWQGRDAYPLIQKAVRKKEVYGEEIVRNEMLKHLGYYVTESSGHNSEYNWWFRKRRDLLEKYCFPGSGWNPGRTAYIVHDYEQGERQWKKKMDELARPDAPLALTRSGEFAAYIMNALLGAQTFRFNGNVPNSGLITNLPRDACVEVPIFAERRGLNPVYVGALPPQLAALNNVNVAVQEMAVEAALTGDRQLVYQACMYDPLTAAVLSLAEIRKMVDELFRVQGPHMPQFRKRRRPVRAAHAG